MADKIRQRKLEWLGHLARMPDNRIPKISLFSWLPRPRPRGGPCKEWRDVVHADLRALKLADDMWYMEATSSREEWRMLYREVQITSTVHHPSSQFDQPVECLEGGRRFRRESDKNKCVEERNRPIYEQRGAIQCGICKRWFRSCGGLTVHVCRNTRTL